MANGLHAALLVIVMPSTPTGVCGPRRQNMLEILQRGGGGRKRLLAGSDRDRLAHRVGDDTDRLVLSADVHERVGKRICPDADLGAECAVPRVRLPTSFGTSPCPRHASIRSPVTDWIPSTVRSSIVQVGAEAEIGEDQQLAGGVPPFGVVARIGLGEAAKLCLRNAASKPIPRVVMASSR